MTNSGDLAGVLIDHSIGRVKIEFVNLDERGLSFEVNMPVADARKFSAGLIKAIDSAEKLQDGQDEEVKNSVRSALKKIVEKIKKTDPE